MKQFAKALFDRLRGARKSISTPGPSGGAAAPQTGKVESGPVFSVRGAMLTDVGRVRPHNEDSVAYVAPDPGSPQEAKGFFAIVADGMGGHAAGEVASAMAVQLLPQLVFASDRSPPDALADAVQAANRTIFEHGQGHPATQGMGTTCTAILVRENQLYLAHVGDSRAYLLRDGLFNQISDDQTLHAQLIRDGSMTPEEAAHRPGGNFILQALGAKAVVAPTVYETGLPLRAGDRLLLCSDGLHGMVSNEDIASIVAANAPSEACRILIDAANAAGGHDNISVGVFDVEAPERPEPFSHASTRPIIVANGLPQEVTRTIVLRNDP